MSIQTDEAIGPIVSVERVLVRGDMDAPEALIIVGTTTVEADIWVNLEADSSKVTVPLAKNTISELATIICSAADSSIKPARIYRQPLNSRQHKGTESEQEFYAVRCPSGGAIWVAEVYAADHDRWNNHEHGRDFTALWQETINGGKPLVVSAVYDDETKQTVTRPKSFPPSNISTAYKFPVGVLLVHGIGQHKVRETLTKFGEPILSFMERLLGQKTRTANAKLSTEQRKAFKGVALDQSLRNRSDFDGIRAVVKGLKDIDPESTSQEQKNGDELDLVCGCVRVEDSFFPESTGEVPAAALARISGFGLDAKAYESHLLVAESHWTEKTVYPSAKELFDWIGQAMPTIASMHASATLRPEARRIKEALQKLRSAFPGSQRTLTHLLHLLIASLVWLIRLGFLLLVIPLLIVFQASLYLMAFISLVPNQMVKKAVRYLIEFLMGSVGQSYALKTSPMRRKAIVSKVTSDLNWLGNHCEKLVVVAHSQGAEVARLMLRNQRWAKVKRWFTVGAGIKPLSLLDPNSAGRRFEVYLQQLFGISSALVLIFLASWLLRPAMDGWLLSTITAVHHWLNERWPWLLGGGLTLFLLSLNFRPANYTFNFNPHLCRNWTDFFSSHDPVPAGRLFEGKTDQISQSLWDPQTHEFCREIMVENFQSTVRDHTSYFQNTEQFVGPVAIEILDLLGFKLCQEAKKDIFLKSSRRRKHLTYAQMICNKIFLLLYGGLFVFTMSSNWPTLRETYAAASNDSSSLLLTLQTLWQSGLIEHILRPVFPALLLLIVAAITLKLYFRRGLRRSSETLIDELAEHARIFGNRV